MPVALKPLYIYDQLCITVAIHAGVATRLAQVPPVAVPAVFSAHVAISTFPATVVLALEVLAQFALCHRAHAI